MNNLSTLGEPEHLGKNPNENDDSEASKMPPQRQDVQDGQVPHDTAPRALQGGEEASTMRSKLRKLQVPWEKMLRELRSSR
jgi:hypothetical protein